jgi:hypothetical protein
VKTKKYYLLAGLGTVIAMFALAQALITATGAFGADPAETVNKIDFVWTALGLMAAVYSFYQIRRLSKN